jgi:hypothetical protein
MNDDMTLPVLPPARRRPPLVRLLATALAGGLGAFCVGVEAPQAVQPLAPTSAASGAHLDV